MRNEDYLNRYSKEEELKVIENARNKKGLTYEELAKRINVIIWKKSK